MSYTAADVTSALRHRNTDAKGIDLLAEALGREKNGAGLRVILDAGLLDAEQVSDIGNDRYRAISPILQSCPDAHIALVTDWMAQTYRARPDVATEILCNVIRAATTDFSGVKTVYRCCVNAGMDVHRPAFVFLTKMGEIANTVDRFDLAYHTPFAGMMCRLPAAEIANLMKDGTFTKLGRIPHAGETMAETGREGQQVTLLEYFGRFHANNTRFLHLIALLDPQSVEIRQGLSDAIASMVKEFGMKDNKTGPTDIAFKIAAMIVAGADLERLGEGLRAIEAKGPDGPRGAQKPGEQRNILHILAAADHVKLGTTSTSRYEPVIAAVERLTTTIGPDLAQTFEFDVNADNGIGKTPLHFAAKSAGTPVIELLLHAGANFAARTVDDVTPEATARALGREDVVSVLQAWAAKQSIQTVINRVRGMP